jgi:hypothetical protein
VRAIKIVLATLTLSTTAWAGGGVPDPVLTGNDVALAETPTALLPARLREILEKNEDGLFLDENGQLRKTLRALTLDLNDDGESEYFVADPASYTGGDVIHIFASDGDEYREIGGVQGEFYTAAPENGHAQLVDTARGGPNSYVRTLWTYEDGTYKEQKKAEYEEDDNGNLVFVQEL